MTTVSQRIGEDQAAELAAFAQALGVPPPASRAPGESPPRAARKPRMVTCKSCAGQALASGDGSGHPWGWYSVSVAVPPELAKGTKPYQWVGTFCSARCLAAGIPAFTEAERLAHQTYTPDPPQRPGVNADLAALMREPPRGRG